MEIAVVSADGGGGALVFVALTAALAAVAVAATLAALATVGFETGAVRGRAGVCLFAGLATRGTEDTSGFGVWVLACRVLRTPPTLGAGRAEGLYRGVWSGGAWK